jgi:hypothetical protein
MDDEPRSSSPPAQPHGGGELRALAQPGRGRKHGNSRVRAASGRQALTALPTTCGEDGTTGASAHAQPKAVGLCASAVVRLERALAHSGAPRKRSRTATGLGKSVQAAGQKELLRYGPTANTVKPAAAAGRTCGERLEAQGGTLLASHGPGPIPTHWGEPAIISHDECHAGPDAAYTGCGRQCGRTTS